MDVIKILKSKIFPWILYCGCVLPTTMKSYGKIFCFWDFIKSVVDQKSLKLSVMIAWTINIEMGKSFAFGIFIKSVVDQKSLKLSVMIAWTINIA